MNLKKNEVIGIETQGVIDRLRDSSRAWQSEGRDAWSELKRLGRGYLPPADRVELARNLHSAIEKLKLRLKAKGISLADFCEEAGLGDEGSKRLYRLTLPPGDDPKKHKLRAVAATYAKLVEKIAQYTVTGVTTVAERVLRGTSLHPMAATERNALEYLQDMLQKKVDDVSEEFGLFAKFRETAERRAEHARSGGSMRWPKYDREIVLGPDADPYEVRRELDRAGDPKFAFWETDVVSYYRCDASWVPIANKSGCRQYDDFFFVPHAHIGALVITQHPQGTAEHAVDLAGEVEWIRRMHGKSGWKPSDDWDEKNYQPRGQTLVDSGAWQHHAWVVIYPAPDNSTLMPMLYIPWEEEGPFLLPLDLKHLRFLRDYATWVEPAQTTNAIDRLNALVLNDVSDSNLEEGLRRTAPWFDYNPFLAAKAKDEAVRERLREQRDRLYSRKIEGAKP